MNFLRFMGKPWDFHAAHSKRSSVMKIALNRFFFASTRSFFPNRVIGIFHFPTCCYDWINRFGNLLWSFGAAPLILCIGSSRPQHNEFRFWIYSTFCHKFFYLFERQTKSWLTSAIDERFDYWMRLPYHCASHINQLCEHEHTTICIRRWCSSFFPVAARSVKLLPKWYFSEIRFCAVKQANWMRWFVHSPCFTPNVLYFQSEPNAFVMFTATNFSRLPMSISERNTKQNHRFISQYEQLITTAFISCV